MRKIFGLAALSLFVIASLPVLTFAAANPNLQVQIFPLECSFDTIDLGYVTSLGLTPEDCFPEPPQPPLPDQPPATPHPTYPSTTQRPSYQFFIPHFNGSTSKLSDGLALPQPSRLRIADRASHDQKNGALPSWVVPTIAFALLVAALVVAVLKYVSRKKILPHSNFKPPHDD